MPKKRAKGRRSADQGDGGEVQAPVVYVTAEAKAMVRQSLIVDRNLMIHKGKAFDKFMARFDKINEFHKLRNFLENQKNVLPNGYCVIERLSKMGHAQIQVALYNGTGWNDMSLKVIFAASKFKRNLTKVRERKAAAQAEQVDLTGLSAEEIEQLRLEYAAKEEQKRVLMNAGDSADEARRLQELEEVKAQLQRAKQQRIQEEKQLARERADREAERLQRLEDQAQLDRAARANAKRARDEAQAALGVVTGPGDQGRYDPNYSDFSGPDDSGYLEYGKARRQEAIVAAEKRRKQAVAIAKARRAKAMEDAEAQADKASVAAERMAVETASMRRWQSERQQAASSVAARRNQALRVGKARQAWQQEQAWLVKKDAGELAAEEEADQRQRLRRRVRSAATHTPRAQGRPSSAPAGGRPNQPLTAVPPSQGGVVQLSHPVVRYGSAQVFARTTPHPEVESFGRVGFCPSMHARPPSSARAGEASPRPGSATAKGAGFAGGGVDAPAWVTPLGKRLAQNRELIERRTASARGPKPRARPASARLNV